MHGHCCYTYQQLLKKNCFFWACVWAQGGKNDWNIYQKGAFTSLFESNIYRMCFDTQILNPWQNLAAKNEDVIHISTMCRAKPSLHWNSLGSLRPSPFQTLLPADYSKCNIMKIIRMGRVRYFPDLLISIWDCLWYTSMLSAKYILQRYMCFNLISQMGSLNKK